MPSCTSFRQAPLSAQPALQPSQDLVITIEDASAGETLLPVMLREDEKG